MNFLLSLPSRWFGPQAITMVVLLALFAALPAGAQEDDYDLLPEDDGRDEVYAICGGCHSIKMVIQQGLPRERWDEMFDWMVEEQGMAELDEETHKIILDYLDEHLNTDHRAPHMQR